MKNLFYSLFLAASLISCSNDDNGSHTGDGQSTEQGVVKIEMTLDNTTNNFEESLLLQVIGDDMDATNVIGAQWESIERPHITTKWFSTNQDIPSTVVYETTNKVRSVTYVSIITPKEEATSPSTATLKFYVNGKLKRTEIVVINNGTVSQINIPFIVSNN